MINEDRQVVIKAIHSWYLNDIIRNASNIENCPLYFITKEMIKMNYDTEEIYIDANCEDCLWFKYKDNGNCDYPTEEFNEWYFDNSSVAVKIIIEKLWSIGTDKSVSSCPEYYHY